MKSRPANRKFILARNVMLIALSLLFLWFLFDTPALTSEQAFRRAMREHFLAPQDPQVFFGEDGRLSALAEVDGIYVQVGVEKRGLKWQHVLWTETEAVDGVYIVPLVARGSSIDSPEVAVLAEGNRVDLAFVYEGETHSLRNIGKQDGWFLFQFVREGDHGGSYQSAYDTFLETNGFMTLGTPAAMDHGSFIFISYDVNGKELQRVEKIY